MEELADLDRLASALEELLAVTTEGRLATLFQLLVGAIIMKGSDAVVEFLRETATYREPDGMATIVVARDMAPDVLGDAFSKELERTGATIVTTPPVEVGYGETPPEGYTGEALHVVDYAKLPRYTDPVTGPAYVNPTAPSTFRFEVTDHTGAAVTCSKEGCTAQATQFTYHNGTHGWCADHSPISFHFSPSLG